MYLMIERLIFGGNRTHVLSKALITEMLHLHSATETFLLHWQNRLQQQLIRHYRSLAELTSFIQILLNLAVLKFFI